QLAGGEATIRGGQAQHPARIELAAVRPVLVRVHCRLRAAGGPAGPQPESSLVAARLRRRDLLRRSVPDPSLEAAIAALADDQDALEGAGPRQRRLDALDARP